MNGTVAPIVSACAQTIVGKVVGELHAIYEEIDEKQKIWLKAAPEFICPTGCGACCHSFEPHLPEPEALYMASWLLVNQPERALELASMDEIPHSTEFPSGCPLQNLPEPATKGGACSVYGGRTLVCRLFGYCGDTDRNGSTRFKVCKFHPFGGTNEELREYSELELRFCFGTLPSLMSDFGTQVSQLLPESASRTELLRIALPRALRKILMLQNLNRSSLFAQALNHTQDSDTDGDNDRPNPTPNLPKAG